MLVAVMLLPTAMQAQKWTNLFDGKTFAGWKQLNGQAKYEIKNGVNYAKQTTFIKRKLLTSGIKQLNYTIKDNFKENQEL